MPLSRPGILTVGALTFLMGWSDFLFPLTLISDDNKRPLTLGIYKFIGQRYITSGLVAGAVKE